MDNISSMTDIPKPGINDRIAARVRELRNRQGLSLEALADASGVSRSMISLVERGESSPTAVVLEKLATCAKLAGGGCARLDIERFVATARHLDPVDGAAAAPPSAAQISAVGAMYAAISDEKRRDAVVDLGLYAASRGGSRA